MVSEHRCRGLARHGDVARLRLPVDLHMVHAAGGGQQPFHRDAVGGAVSGQSIPKRQQDALPLQTIAQANAGAIVDFGDSPARFWDATALAINGIARSTIATSAGTYYFLATPYLDLRGLNFFGLLVDRLVPGGGAAVPAACNL